MKRRPVQFVPIIIAVAVTGIVCLLEILPRFYPAFDLAQRVEWITYDRRVRSAARHTSDASTNLAFVYISDDSISAVSDGSLGYKYGLYWPRHVYGRVLKELADENCKAVAFDVLFGELRPDHAPVVMPDNSLMESDDYFAHELRTGRAMLATTPSLIPPELFRTNCFSLAEISAEKDSDGVLRRAKAFRDIRFWHPLLNQIAREAGFDLNKTEFEKHRLIFHLPGDRQIGLDLDDTGQLNLSEFVSKITGEKPSDPLPKVFPFEMRRIWQMGVALAAQQLEADLNKATVQKNLITLHGKDGDVKIPVDHENNFYIDWRMKYDDRLLTIEPIESLLQKQNDRREGKTPENRLAGRLVVVGSTATGNDLTDRGATPLENDTFLVGTYWNIANSVLTQKFITPSPLEVALALICGMAALAALVTWKLRSVVGSVMVVLLMVLYVVVSVWLFVQFRIWIPITLPVVGAILTTHICLVGWRAISEQKEKRHIKAVFKRLVSPNVVNELLQAEKLALGGARRNITIFFADVRGFTQLTDSNYAKAQQYVRESQFTPEQAEAFFDEQARDTLNTVNLYLSTIADIIKKHNGTLDKYIGDCVMAFWGSPTSNEQHALCGVRAAIEAQRGVFALNERRALENVQREQENLERINTGQRPLDPLPLLALGTGINSGEAIVGLMGSEAHIVSYTVFGREVNLASRLEGVSGRSRIIIGENTFVDLKRDDPKLAATCVELEAVKVKGISDAVKIYEVPWQVVDKIDSRPS